MVPDISYLTMADYYVLMCFFLMILLVVGAAMVGCATYLHSRWVQVQLGVEPLPHFFWDMPRTPLYGVNTSGVLISSISNYRGRFARPPQDGMLHYNPGRVRVHVVPSRRRAPSRGP